MPFAPKGMFMMYGGKVQMGVRFQWAMNFLPIGLIFFWVMIKHNGPEIAEVLTKSFNMRFILELIWFGNGIPKGVSSMSGMFMPKAMPVRFHGNTVEWMMPDPKGKNSWCLTRWEKWKMRLVIVL